MPDDQSNLELQNRDEMPSHNSDTPTPDSEISLNFTQESNEAPYYSRYLHLEKILSSQHPLSEADGQPAHDEMLFIIIHQSYELWFKLIIFELDSVIEIMNHKDKFGDQKIDDNSSDMYDAVHRLDRVIEVLRLLNAQIAVLETMRPLDFLDFRSLLGTASGFQSIQFKLIEVKLGLQPAARYQGDYYRNVSATGVTAKDSDVIKSAEADLTLLNLLVNWLERMPFLSHDRWVGYSVATEQKVDHHPFWSLYRERLLNSFKDSDKGKISEFDERLFGAGGETMSSAALRSALFIMLYRDRPLLRQPYELLEAMIEIDEQLSIWRFRHLMMVKRMLGSKTGTGGTKIKGESGDAPGYLEGALASNRIYKDLSALATFFIERKRLPQLPPTVTAELSFRDEEAE